MASFCAWSRQAKSSQQTNNAVWKHRRTPALHAVLSGGNCSRMGGYQNRGRRLKPVLPKLSREAAQRQTCRNRETAAL